MNNRGNKWLGLGAAGLGILAVVLFMGGRFYQIYADQNQIGASAASLGEQIPTKSLASAEPVAAVKNGQIQEVSISVTDNGYQAFIVQKGLPVRLTMNAEQSALNGCNGKVVFPSFNVEKKLRAGANVIEFTPDQTGTFDYSCWMGMIQSSVIVVDDLEAYDGTKDNGQNSLKTGNAVMPGSGLGSGNSCCVGNSK